MMLSKGSFSGSQNAVSLFYSTESCKKPHLPILNYHANKTVFVPEDTIQYACLEGYQTADNMPTGTTSCGINGEWSPAPQCLGKYYYLLISVTLYTLCEGFPLKTFFGFVLISSISCSFCRVVHCILKYSLFVAIECEMPTLPNGDFFPKEGKYRNGDVVNFTCANNYVRVGPVSAQCYYFGWFPSPPLCKGNVSVNFIVVRSK